MAGNMSWNKASKFYLSLFYAFLFSLAIYSIPFLKDFTRLNK